MTQQTAQFAIKVAVVAASVILGAIVIIFGTLILVMHDGAATTAVVDNLTKLGYALTLMLLGIVGGHQVMAAVIAKVVGN